MHDVLEDASRAAASEASDGPSSGSSMCPLLIAVPLYRKPELLAPLVAALRAMAGELRSLDATVLLIDDSPDDVALSAELDRVVPLLAAIVPVERICNPANLGFVRSANVALARGRDTGRDVLLLNSDALPRPGAFAEMVAVAALDPMTAVVSPRSDNAIMCNSPDLAALREGGGDRAYAAHRAIERHLPRVSYVPTAVGFCLLIRHAMLREFGLFDEIYGGGYNEENDFIRRCNRRGYRAVLANWAYAHHLGGASFAQTGESPIARDTLNREILLERYPEYDTVVARWFESAEYRAQRLLSGLVPRDDGRLPLLFDCGTLRSSYNGTYEHIRALVTAFAARHAARYDIAVLCEADAFEFHGLDRVAGVRWIAADEALARPAAMAMRIGQPFAPEEFAPLRDYAPVTGVVMLDTIAMDCQQLDDIGLGALWATVADEVDAIGFNSAFSRDQFKRRFDVPGRVVEFVSRCSTDIADYAGGSSGGVAQGRGVLLVGNHYPHKHVRETLAALRAAAPDVPVTVFGIEVEDEPGVVSYAAGDLPQAMVDALYAEAGVVLFPSHYEGFGLPIVHALAHGRPVIARDLPSAREIRALSAAGDNLHLAGSTDEMVAFAIDPPRWRAVVPRPGAPASDWGAAADAVADAVARAIARFDFAVCRRRQEHSLAHRSGVLGDAGRWSLSASVDERDGMPLPAHGRGFMLGDMIEVANPPRPSGGFARGLAFGAWRRPAGVRIEAALNDRGADDISRELLERLRGGSEGTAITLVLEKAEQDDAAAVLAATILLSCGCGVSSIETRPRGVIGRGVYRHDWTTLLDGPADDAGFIRHVYRHTLGRNPDPAGGRNYLSELADGLTRDAMLRLFLGSAERRSMIAAQMKRRGLRI